MINNFIQISAFISNLLTEKNNSDYFFFIQIIQRSKEVEELGSNNRVLKTYFINNSNQLDQRYTEIIKLCEDFNARAYIHLTPRKWSVIASKCLVHNAELIANNQYEAIKNSLASIIGKNPSLPKFWVLDLDFKSMRKINTVRNLVNMYRCESRHTILLELETKNGWHFITNPFDTQTFFADCIEKRVPKIEIHKNNPTILFTP